jgi:hypothetical protein
MMPQKPDFLMDKKEVKSLIEAPLSHLLHPQTIKRKDFLVHQNRSLKDVPYFDVEGKIIWGATAMILGELLFVLKGIET